MNIINKQLNPLIEFFRLLINRSYKLILKIISIIALCIYSLPVNASLEDRLDGNAYYDTVLDITWYTEANHAANSAWDDGILPNDGWLTWSSAEDWVSTLVVNGIAGWRMANMDVNDDMVVVECAVVTEEECRDNEYGYMFFHNGITGDNPGPFSGKLVDYGYWSSSMYENYSDMAWLFTFGAGIQHPLGTAHDRHVWAVRDGDVESDIDGDGVFDALDNCPDVANVDQTDKDDNGVGDACEPPKISGIWPLNGVLGESVSIFIFGENLNNNFEIYFNGSRQYLVQAVTTEMLIVRMTVTEESVGPVTVITDNGFALAPQEFGLPLTGLQITGLWPTSVAPGEFVLIFGNDLDDSAGATEVRVGATLAEMSQVVNSNMAIFSVPSFAHTSPVYVTTPSGTASSGKDLIIFP